MKAELIGAVITAGCIGIGYLLWQLAKFGQESADYDEREEGTPEQEGQHR
jgi:hypothetical protein